MKITMYYEDKFHPTTLEVAEDKSAIARRTVQEILDEEVND